MSMPVELVHNSPRQIAFVQRSGLRTSAGVETVRLRMPLIDQNHIGGMYAGALFTLAEIPGGALFAPVSMARISFLSLKCACARRPATATYLGRNKPC
jgi:hypothetical protein